MRRPRSKTAVSLSLILVFGWPLMSVVMVAEFGDALREIDLNPVIVSNKACVAVDALVVGNAGHGDSN